MGRAVRMVVPLALPAFAACGGPSAETSPRTDATSAAPATSSSAPASTAFDVDAVRALLATRAEEAKRARAALVAPHSGLFAGTETLLPALGPCVRPTAAEAKAMEKRIRAWVERQVPRPEKGGKKDIAIDPMAWGCLESRGTVARVRWQYQGKCNDGHAILRVGKTVDVLSRVSGIGDDCSSGGAFLDELAVIAMLDVDGDGAVEPLVMRNHHEVTESGRVWIFVAGLTPQPHMELHWRHVERTPHVRLVATETGTLLHVARPVHYAPPEADGLFLEVLQTGVVTATRPTTSRSASVRALEKVIEEASDYRGPSTGEAHGPWERAIARAALRRAGVDDAAIVGVLGPEAPPEARERILRFARNAGAETKDRPDDGSEGLCRQPTVAPEVPWQIPAWGRCVVPAKETRDRVEPAIAAWVKKRSGQVLREWLPDEKGIAAPARDDIVARWGCEHEGRFFVQLDGGETWQVSALLQWGGKDLKELSSVGGVRCENWCESGPDRDLDVALTDLDGDGDVEAIVRAFDGCAHSPRDEELHECTKTEVHGLGPPRGAKRPAAFSREDPKTVASICRVDDVVHVLGLDDDQDGTSDVLAVVGAAGLSPATSTAPYLVRRKELVARREAAELVGESTRAQSPTEPAHVRAALRLLGVSDQDATLFLATPPSR